MDMKDRRAVILKNIAAPSLKCGIPPKALMKLLQRGVPCFLFNQFLLGALVVVGFYAYYFRKTQENPFFLEEEEAKKAHRKTQNIHPVKGNYYSA